MSVYRIYVEKKPEFAVEAQSVLNDLQTALRLSVTGVRILNRYDADHLTEEAFQKAIPTVFSEPAVDVTYDTLPECTGNQRMFAVEYLPGQFDQRADSCEQCIQILLQGERCRVRTAQIYIISGNMTDAEFQQIQAYLINPVERRKASLDKPETLDSNYEIPTEVKTLHGFCDRTKEQLDAFIREYGLAMDLDDIQFCQDYFKNTEHRDPTITEIRMIDTYWSDHCRHTTFSTNIEQVEIGAPYIQKTYDAYLNIRHELGRDAKPITLMDMATLAVKKLKADGKLNDLDESEEINACSVKIKVDVAGREEDWILMFKNETHNHPTEIEPFGGAATCLGGAIRDPLSGRSYVYQAMRVTGAADPTVPISQTLKGKLCAAKDVALVSEKTVIAEEKQEEAKPERLRGYIVKYMIKQPVSAGFGFIVPEEELEAHLEDKEGTVYFRQTDIDCETMPKLNTKSYYYEVIYTPYTLHGKTCAKDVKIGAGHPYPEKKSTAPVAVTAVTKKIVSKTLPLAEYLEAEETRYAGGFSEAWNYLPLQRALCADQ